MCGSMFSATKASVSVIMRAIPSMLSDMQCGFLERLPVMGLGSPSPLGVQLRRPAERMERLSLIDYRNRVPRDARHHTQDAYAPPKITRQLFLTILPSLRK